MATGDPLRVGLTQPPDNRATSATMLVHTGSAFGTQITALWVLRNGSPVASSAIRGENFSTGAAGGVTRTGVLGMIQGSSAGVGVMGTATGQQNLFFGETGVMGVTNSFGVVGRSLTGLIEDSPGVFLAGTGVVGRCDGGVGVHGFATSGWGVIGQSVSRPGVAGRSTSGPGVEARSDQSHGVVADAASGNGVEARSRDGFGVQGTSEQGLAGVRGRSTGRFGVLGTATSGVGVAGTSERNAVQGVSTGTGGASIGVVGLATAGQGVLGASDTGIGIGGRSARGWAGYFEGNVIVRGALVVTGAKSAAVEHPDGTLRALYCVETPESWFEDIGEVAMTEATATVALDEDFAALVRRRNYHVFLTSYGPEAVYVRRRGADSFEIARVARAERGRRHRRLRVGYRIIARRADVKAVRLPEVTLPAEPADVIDVAPPAGKARTRRAAKETTPVALEPLPATPKLPELDLNALVEERPETPDTAQNATAGD